MYFKYLPGILNRFEIFLVGKSEADSKRPPIIHIPSVVTTVPKFCRRLSIASCLTTLPSKIKIGTLFKVKLQLRLGLNYSLREGVKVK